MIAEVVDYDCYQLKKIEWEPGRDRCIVDIGANVGVTALVLSQIPGARVVCYEPDAGNCSFLRGNIERNGGSGSTEAGGTAASVVGEWRGLRTAAQ